jgi:hypothetical protein
MPGNSPSASQGPIAAEASSDGKSVLSADQCPVDGQQEVTQIAAHGRAALLPNGRPQRRAAPTRVMFEPCAKAAGRLASEPPCRSRY